MDQRFGQAEPLLHSAREPIDEVITLVGEVQQFQHVVDDPLAPDTWNLVRDGKEVEKLPNLHPVVDPKTVGHIADAFPYSDGVARNSMPIDNAIPGGRLEQGGQETDGCALARPIGTNETEHFASFDLEVQIADGHEFAVNLGEISQFDHDWPATLSVVDSLVLEIEWILLRDVVGGVHIGTWRSWWTVL